MAGMSKILEEMKSNLKGARLKNFKEVCEHYFGKPRQSGSSHCIYKTPWPSDPCVNIQDKKGKTKPYQV